MKQYIFCLLFALAGAGAADAQSKVPDMSRYSKAPVSPERSVVVSPTVQKGFTTNHTGVPDMSRFTKAPIQTGGGAARSAARTSAAVNNTTLPSNQAAEKGESRKTAPVVLTEAASEQLKLPAPAIDVKPAAKQ